MAFILFRVFDYKTEGGLVLSVFVESFRGKSNRSQGEFSRTVQCKLLSAVSIILQWKRPRMELFGTNYAYFSPECQNKTLFGQNLRLDHFYWEILNREIYSLLRKRWQFCKKNFKKSTLFRPYFRSVPAYHRNFSKNGGRGIWGLLLKSEKLCSCLEVIYSLQCDWNKTIKLICFYSIISQIARLLIFELD